MTLARRLFGVAAGLLVVAVLFALFGHGYLLRAFLTAELLEQVLNRALGPASNGLYEVSVGSVELQVASGSLSASDVALRAVPDRVEELRAEGALPAVRADVQVAAITIRGVRAWPLLRGHALVATEIAVRQPHVALRVSEGLGGEAIGERSARAEAGTRAAVGRLSRVELDQVRIDPRGAPAGERVAFANDLRFAIDRIVVPLKDDRYTLELRDLEVSTSFGLVRLGGLGYEPRASREAYLGDTDSSRGVPVRLEWTGNGRRGAALHRAPQREAHVERARPGALDPPLCR